MKLRYKVISTSRIGDYIKIVIQQEAAVEEKENFNPLEIAKSEDGGFDMAQMVGNLTNMTTKMLNKDTITVSYEDWQKDKINIDDIITLDVNKE